MGVRLYPGASLRVFKPVCFPDYVGKEPAEPPRIKQAPLLYVGRRQAGEAEGTQSSPDQTGGGERARVLRGRRRS